MAKKGKGKRKSKSTDMPTSCAPSAAEQRKWRAESDLRSLRASEEIKKDSSRVKEVKRLIKQEQSALRKIRV